MGNSLVTTLPGQIIEKFLLVLSEKQFQDDKERKDFIERWYARLKTLHQKEISNGC